MAADRTPIRSLQEIRQHHVVIQKWDLSCGAAALATILNYQYGDFVSERSIATALMKRKEYIAHPMLVRIRQGFSLLDLKRYVDQRGYEGIGYGKLTLHDLIKYAPIMVPLNFYGYNHFVVFRGVRKNQVLLADPAWGNRAMTIKRFEHVWISYPKIGKVGFVVALRNGNLAPANGLAPHSMDYIMF
ncbi:MAG TPA: C39 family peptidase [Nitrococcus sp.]|nr:C39 family peptidase [Nitrococcus sp.]